jgi:hypothetical protein
MSRVTAALFDQKMRADSVKESTAKFLASTARDHHVMKAQVKRDDHIDAKRRTQAIHSASTKYRMEETMQQHELMQTQRNSLVKQDDALADALQGLEQKRISELAYAKRVCEESAEINELKAQLEAAKINKIRETQLRERELIQRQETRREKLIEEQMERDRAAAAEQENQDIARRTFLHIQGRKVLEQQIEDKKYRNEEAVQQHLKERAQVDEIVARIQQEDYAFAQRKQQQTREFFAAAKAFLAERESSRLAEFQRAQEELRKIEQYQQLQEARLRDLESKKGERTREHDTFVSRIIAELEAKRKEELQIRELLDELYQDEVEQRARAADAEASRQRQQRKEEMITVNERQLAYKEERQRQLLEEELQFRKSMMDKFLADARIEAMNAERRKREIALYRQEIERLVSERRRAFEEQIERDIKEMQSHSEREGLKEQVVAEERARLLREHAEFKDYLPKGVFKDAREFESVHGVRPSAEMAAQTKHFKVANPLFRNRDQFD